MEEALFTLDKMDSRMVQFLKEIKPGIGVELSILQAMFPKYKFQDLLDCIEALHPALGLSLHCLSSTEFQWIILHEFKTEERVTTNLDEHVIPGNGISLNNLSWIIGMRYEPLLDILLDLERKKSSGIVVFKNEKAKGGYWIVRLNGFLEED